MRRWISVILMTGAVLAAGLAPVEARRIFIPTGSSDGGSGSTLFWVLFTLVVAGGGAFKLLRTSAGLVARGASAVSQKVAPTDARSEWADRVNARLGPMPDDDNQPVQRVLTPAGDAPKRGATVVMSGQKRSTGFGGGRGAEPGGDAVLAPASPAATVVAPVAPSPAAQRAATPPVAAAAVTRRPAADMAAAPRMARQPRVGGAAPRAQFGTKRA